MKNKFSIDDLLMEMGEIIQMIQKHKKPISSNITPQVISDIDLLEKGIPLLHILNEAMLASTNSESQKLTISSLETHPTISSRDKQLIKRATQMSQDAEALGLALSKGMQLRKKKEKTDPSSKKEKQLIKQRRKLFKPLTGDNKWIPL